MSAVGPQFYDFVKKLKENGDTLPSSSTSDVFEPEFVFDNLTCCLCNGYYGPSFGEPVCATCHEFLYPDIPHQLPNSFIFSEKKDDGDSGNDEPSAGEFMHNDQRFTRALQQQGLPTWAFRNSLNAEVGVDEPVVNRPRYLIDPLFPARGPSFSGYSVGYADNFGPNGGPSGGPNGGPNMGGPIGGPNMGGPIGGPNFGGPNGGPNFGGPNGGPNFGGHNFGGPNFGGPNGGPNIAGPNGGPNIAGPNGGPNIVGPNGGPNIAGPNGAPNIAGPNGGPNIAGPNGGPNNGGPNRDPNIFGFYCDPNIARLNNVPIIYDVFGGPIIRFPNRRPRFGRRNVGRRNIGRQNWGPHFVALHDGNFDVYQMDGEPNEASDDDGLGPAVPDEGRSPPLPLNLARSLAALSTPRLPDNLAPGLVEQLPSEVLLCIFSYLDDQALCACAMVSARWQRLVCAHVPQSRWAAFTRRRWPLFRPVIEINDWHKKYQALVDSCFCHKCVLQMFKQAQPPYEENAWRRNRLRNEIKMLRVNPPEGCAAIPLDPKCCHWQAMVTGPVGSAYEGGVFFLYIQIPFSYPMSPPVVRFLTRILHPNVSRHGDVGIDSVHHNWSLALTLSKLLISIQSLLTDPYTAVCMEPEVGEMYVNDRERFIRIARRWTWHYAMHDMCPKVQQTPP